MNKLKDVEARDLVKFIHVLLEELQDEHCSLEAFCKAVWSALRGSGVRRKAQLMADLLEVHEIAFRKKYRIKENNGNISRTENTAGGSRGPGKSRNRGPGTQ